MTTVTILPKHEKPGQRATLIVIIVFAHMTARVSVSVNAQRCGVQLRRLGWA
jgi:hypothetical protein